MTQLNDEQYYIGIDVGTGSVRAGIFKPDGTLVSSSTLPIDTHRNAADHRIFEQSTTNIWSSVCTAVKTILAEANLDSVTVKGLGFDATCSLVVVDWEGRPIVVTKGEQLGTVGERNIILWADQRAEKQAEVINSTGSILLDYFGGTMSVRLLSFTIEPSS
jgi:ribulose kinase